jgi:FkbM family methyltransferase
MRGAGRLARLVCGSPDVSVLGRVNGFVFPLRLRNHVERDMFLFSGYARHELQFLSDAAKSQRDLRREVVLYDIGANIGQHSICLSGLVDSVHSFEPFKPVADRLLENVALNHLQNVFLHQVALSNETGFCGFYSPPPENCGSGRLASLSATVTAEVAKPICQVPAFDSCEYILSNGLPMPHIMKIDAEGAECLILTSLAPLLALSRPIILFEVSDSTIASWSPEVGESVGFGQLYKLEPDTVGYALNPCPRPSRAGDYVVLPSDYLNDVFLRVISNRTD